MELPKTNEDGLIALGAKAKETGVDLFLVKIERKGQYGLPESLTSAEGVSLQYIIKPEEWLPGLFGGGNFILTCYHASELTMPVARLALNFKGEPTMNWTALDAGTWSGPKNFTRREPSAGQTFTEEDRGERRPPWGGGSRIPPGGAGGTDTAFARFLFEQTEKQRLQDREFFKELIEKAAQPPPKPSLGAAEITALIGSVAAPVVGLIGAFISAGAATRAENAKLAAESQRERDRMFSEQQKETREVLKALATPKPVDPIIERLVNDQRKLNEKLLEGGNSETESSMQMMNVMQQMFGFTTKAMSLAAEAQLDKGDKGGGILPAFREAMTAIEHIMTARMQAGAQRPAVPGQQVQPQLPAVAQPQPAAPVPIEQLIKPGTAVEQVFQAILEHQDAKAVAARIIELADTDEPSFVQAIGQYDNNIITLAQAVLGSVQEDGGIWLLQPKHQFYLKTILMEVEKSPVFGGPEVEEIHAQVAPGIPEKSQEGGAKPATPAPTPVVAAPAAPAPAAEPTVVAFPSKKKSRKLERPDQGA